MVDLFKKEELRSLKAKITGLEEEIRKLSLQLEKKDEKTRMAVASRQEVDRELNESRQKISSLENDIKKLKEEKSGELKFRFSESFSKNRFDEVLYLLGSMESKRSSLETVYLAENDPLENVTKDLTIDSDSVYLIEKIESQTGKAIFYDANRIVGLVVVPVFPILDSEHFVDRRFRIEPLKNSLESEMALVINAHAGETFIGVIENDGFVEHDIVRSSVMGKHSKGGWSQKRFEKLIEEDVKHHADKVRSVLEHVIEKHSDIRYVIAGGEGKLIRKILEGYDYPVIMKSLDVVSKKSAEQVLREVMAVRVYGI